MPSSHVQIVWVSNDRPLPADFIIERRALEAALTRQLITVQHDDRYVFQFEHNDTYTVRFDHGIYFHEESGLRSIELAVGDQFRIRPIEIPDPLTDIVRSEDRPSARRPSSHVRILLRRSQEPVPNDFVILRHILDSAVRMGSVTMERDYGYLLEDEHETHARYYAQLGFNLYDEDRTLVLRTGDMFQIEPVSRFAPWSHSLPTVEEDSQDEPEPLGSAQNPIIVSRINCPLEWAGMRGNENIWRIRGRIYSTDAVVTLYPGNHIIIRTPRSEHIHGQYRTIQIDPEMFRQAVPHLTHIQDNLWSNTSRTTLDVGGTLHEVYRVRPGETFLVSLSSAATGTLRSLGPDHPLPTPTTEEERAHLMHRAGQQAGLSPIQQAIIRAAVINGCRIGLAPGTRAVIQFTVQMDGDPTAELTSPAPYVPNTARSRYDLLMDDDDPLIS